MTVATLSKHSSKSIKDCSNCGRHEYTIKGLCKRCYARDWYRMRGVGRPSRYEPKAHLGKHVSSVSNIREQRFLEHMRAKGLDLLAQPYIPSLRYRPDFYSPKENLYYEVVGTRQAYQQNKGKISKVIAAGIPLRVVTADGEPYIALGREYSHHYEINTVALAQVLIWFMKG